MADGDTIMIVTFTEHGDEIGVSTEFARGVPVGQVFDLCGKAINGLVLTARKIGRAKGMTDEQVDKAIFGDSDASEV